jgi:hypothetical protein
VAQPLTVALPPNLVMTDGWVVTIAAVDATTGADVTGVTITEALIQVDNIAGTALGSGAFKMLNPVLVTQA